MAAITIWERSVSQYLRRLFKKKVQFNKRLLKSKIKMATHSATPESGATEQNFGVPGQEVSEMQITDRGQAEEVAIKSTQFNIIDPLIKAQYRLHQQLSWGMGIAAGHVLSSMVISPKLNEWTQHLSNMYNTWGGGFDVQIMLAGTGFHAGKLAITKIPPNINPKELTAADLTAFPYEIIDVKSQDSIYITGHDQRPVAYHYTMNKSLSNTTTTGLDYTNLVANGGTIVLWVLNPLTSAGSETKSVNISIFTKPSMDFQFAQLVSPDRKGQVIGDLPNLLMHGSVVDMEGSHGERICTTMVKSSAKYSMRQTIGCNGPIEKYKQQWVKPAYSWFWGGASEYQCKGAENIQVDSFWLIAAGSVGYPVLGMMETAVGSRDDGLTGNTNYYIAEVYYSGAATGLPKILIATTEGPAKAYTFYFKCYPVTAGVKSKALWCYKKIAAISMSDKLNYIGALAPVVPFCMNQGVVRQWPTGNNLYTLKAPLDEVLCTFTNLLGTVGEGSLQTDGIREQLREQRYKMPEESSALMGLYIDGVLATYFRLMPEGFFTHKKLKTMKSWQISYKHKPNTATMKFINYLDQSQQLPTLGEAEKAAAALNTLRLRMEEEEFELQERSNQIKAAEQACKYEQENAQQSQDGQE